MSLREKDDNNIEAMSISCICGTNKEIEENLIKETYANMILANNNKALSVFIYYNIKNQINGINLKILTSNDTLIKSTETMKIVDYLRIKREMQLRHKKVGRNDLCPCGSGKKYKNCCGK